jgi:hypothetical protein
MSAEERVERCVGTKVFEDGSNFVAADSCGVSCLTEAPKLQPWTAPRASQWNLAQL